MFMSRSVSATSLLRSFSSRSISNAINSLQNDQKNLQPFENIPGPRGLPVIGNIWRYIPLIGDYDVDDLRSNAVLNRQKYGTIVREKIHDKLTVLHLFDPDDIDSLFRQDPKYPSRRSHLALLKYRLDRPDKYNDGGIVPENGLRWYKQRSYFNQYLLSKSKVASYANMIDSITSTTLQELDRLFSDKKLLEIETFEKTVFNRWSLDNTSALFLACRIEDLDSRYIQRLLDEIDNTLIASHATEMRTQKWMKHPDKCKWYQILVKSQDFLYDFAQSRVDKVIEDEANKKTIETSMVHDWLFSEKIDRKDVIAFVMDAFEAGIHTTSYTLAFLFYHLSRNPKYQELIAQEVEGISIDKPIDAEDVEKLKWLGLCLREVLRLHPIAIGTGRLAMSDIRIRDYHIPKGTMIIAHNERIGRDDAIYENANDFQPERWIHYKSCPKHLRPSPFAFRPFGLGARSCIGQRVIDLEMRILITRLLQKFIIKNTTEIKTKTIMVHVIGGPFGVTLQRRVSSRST